MRDRPRGVAAAIAVLAMGLPAIASADDTVFLKKGGRLRGTVVEEDPVKGVRIKLYDGSLRSVAAHDLDHVQYGDAPVQVAPPIAAPPLPAVQGPLPYAPPAMGSLHVESDAPATVTVDGGEIGKTPADVGGLFPGRHRVRIKYDAGGTDDHTVLITSNDTARLDAKIPPARLLFNATRSGVTFGAGLEPIFMFVYHPEGYSALAYEGLRLNAFVNVGLSPAVDFRATFFVTDAAGAYGALAPIGGIAAFRFNAGTVYSAEIGLEAGYALGTNLSAPDGCSTSPLSSLYPPAPGCFTNVWERSAFVGVEASVASFRFGSRGQFEAELREGIMLPVSHNAWFENGLVLRYLLLPGGFP